MSPVHTFLLTRNVNAATVYGGCVLIFVLEKQRQITLTRHANIYTEFITVWTANLCEEPAFALYSMTERTQFVCMYVLLLLLVVVVVVVVYH